MTTPTSDADRVEVLREYERRLVPLSSATARDLVAIADGRVVVSPAPGGGYVVQAREHVGAIVLPGLRLLIRPKVPMENLLLLLEAGMSESAWRDERFAFATTPDLLAAFASFYVRTCESALRGGLLRKYRTLYERLATVRGRIDLTAQLRRPGLDSPVACSFDEHTDDITENRVVRAAIVRLLRVAGLDPLVRRRLRRELTRFRDVGTEIPDLSIVERLHYDRLNRHYAPLVALSLLVLRNVTLQDAPGNATANAFLLDMNDLFQRFVTARLHQALAPDLDLEPEPLVYLGRGRRVGMRPDLVFRRWGVRTFVGDVKYKLRPEASGYSSDYYQLLAYATALAVPEGVLVYCTSDEDAPPGLVEVRHSEVRLYTWRLRLDGSRADVEHGIADLAAWLRARSAQALSA